MLRCQLYFPFSSYVFHMLRGAFAVGLESDSNNSNNMVISVLSIVRFCILRYN